MRRGRWMWITAYVVAALVAVGGGAYYLQHRHSTTSPTYQAGQLPVLTGTSFDVTISVFKQQRQLEQGATVEIGVQAEAKQGVRDLQLWDGSHEIDAHAPGAGGGASFRYAAVTVGPHLLYAKGIASDGVTATSPTYPLDVLPLSVVPRAGGGAAPPTVQVAALPGEAAADVQARLGLPAGSVTMDAAPGTGLAAGLTATVRPPTGTSALDGSSVVVDGGTPTPNASLIVSAVPHGCGVQARVSGGSGPITLAQATSGRPGFTVAATSRSGSVTTLGSLLPGLHVLTAQSGTTQSAPVEFTVPQSCASQAGWTGAVTLIGDQLTLPAPISRGYVYLGVDDQPFVRIPADKSAFLTSTGRRIDLAGMMPALSGRRLVVQAWQQAGLRATQVATGAFTPGHGVTLADVIGEPDVLTILGHDNAGPEPSAITLTKDQKLTFSWSDASPRVTGVQWQILAVPLSAGIHDLDPVGLVDTGYSRNTAGDPPDPHSIYIAPAVPDAHGVFTVDTHTISRNQQAASGNFFLDLSQFAPQTFYVRAIAMGPGGAADSGQAVPTGTVSQNITLSVPGVPTTDPDKFAIDAFLVFPGHAPNPDLEDCIDVTGTHWQDWRKGGKFFDGSGSEPFTYAFYPKDGQYCYDDFDHPTGYCDDVLCEVGNVVDALASGLGDLWDLIATAYNGIINEVVTLVSKFDPVCLALGAASSSAGDACVSVGKIVARAAISAVLAFFGLPPSLPTTHQLAAIAQGDLSELGEQLLDELGVPCDDLTLDPSESDSVKQLGSAAGVSVPTDSDGQLDVCRVAIEAAINAVKGEVQQQVSQTSAESVGLPPCQPGECTVTADPGGHTQPLVVNVVAHRVAGAAKAAKFPISVTLQGAKSFTPAPFQSGSTYLTTLPGNPNEIIAFLSFDQPTPDFDISGVAPGDQVLAEIDDNGKYYGTSVLTGSATAFGTYLPEVARVAP